MAMIPFHKGKRLTPADALIQCEVCHKHKFVWSWDMDCWVDDTGTMCKTVESIVGDEHTVVTSHCKCGHVVSITYNSPDGSFVYIPDRYSY